MIQYEFKEQIAKKLEETGLKSTDKGWIKAFQEAVTEVINSLGGEDAARQDYGEIARKWNEGALPEELRRK